MGRALSRTDGRHAPPFTDRSATHNLLAKDPPVSPGSLPGLRLFRPARARTPSACLADPTITASPVPSANKPPAHQPPPPASPLPPGPSPFDGPRMLYSLIHFSSLSRSSAREHVVNAWVNTTPSLAIASMFGVPMAGLPMHPSVSACCWSVVMRRTFSGTVTASDAVRISPRRRPQRPRTAQRSAQSYLISTGRPEWMLSSTASNTRRQASPSSTSGVGCPPASMQCTKYRVDSNHQLCLRARWSTNGYT